jgi:hypothetical protein
VAGVGPFTAIAPRASDRFPLHFAVPMAVVTGPLLAFGVVF